MSDLYHIPNDDGKTYRLKKFVEYQHEVPSTHYRFVGEYARRKGFGKDAIVDLAFLLSSTYSEITTVFLYDLLETADCATIWEQYKDRLNFGSARKYAKSNNEFVPLMNEWKAETEGRPYEYVKYLEADSGEETFKRIFRKITTLKGVGRFAADLFLEMIVYMKADLEINVSQPTLLDWKHCANLTSGIFNIFYEDEKANEYDKKKALTDEEKRYLTLKLGIIQKEIKETYPDQDCEICMFIGKICSFRNLFKNARYGGFHHDRQLGVLREYEKEFPQYQSLWDECYSIRKAIYPKRFLGELNGWGGIRKERKSLWLKTGLTGVEA